MRIACIYLPSFPVQVHVRRNPRLAGQSFAVARDGRVVSASRAAYELGVRPGDDVQAARDRVACGRGELTIIAAEPDAYREAACALADSLMSLSRAVDIGADDGWDIAELDRAHRALFAHVPAGARGATFGEKLIAAVNRHGMRARIGIADDRFTAWIAAATFRGGDQDGDGPASGLFAQTVTSVPRGGSGAFLAPFPLSMLPLDGDLRRLLGALKIHTIGDFAALPPPTGMRRYTDGGVDLHGLARGDGPNDVLDYRPDGPIREGVHLAPGSPPEHVAFAARTALDRVSERLRGRGRAASGLELTVGRNGALERLKVALPSPTTSGRAMADALRRRLAALDDQVTELSFSVIADTEPQGDELDLFEARPHRRTRRGKSGRRRGKQLSLLGGERN